MRHAGEVSMSNLCNSLRRQRNYVSGTNNRAINQDRNRACCNRNGYVLIKKKFECNSPIKKKVARLN